MQASTRFQHASGTRPTTTMAGDGAKAARRCSPRLLAFVLAFTLVLDVALPALLGTVPGPGCVDCTYGLPSFMHKVRLLEPAHPACCLFTAARNVRQVWPQTPQSLDAPAKFYLGESCFDLFCLALGRLAAFATLAHLLRSRRSPVRQATAPLLQPLHLQEPDTPAESPAVKPPRVTAARLGLACRATAAATLAYSSAKGFARLLQSGYGKGAGFGLLLLEGTTPPELEFWCCLIGAALFAELEARCF